MNTFQNRFLMSRDAIDPNKIRWFSGPAGVYDSILNGFSPTSPRVIVDERNTHAIVTFFVPDSK